MFYSYQNLCLLQLATGMFPVCWCYCEFHLKITFFSNFYWTWKRIISKFFKSVIFVYTSIPRIDLYEIIFKMILLNLKIIINCSASIDKVVMSAHNLLLKPRFHFVLFPSFFLSYHSFSISSLFNSEVNKATCISIFI